MPLPEGTENDGLRSEMFRVAQQVVGEAGFDTSLYAWLDVPVDVPYREPTDDSAAGLWVQLKHRPLQRLGNISFLLGELRNKPIARPRLIFPPEVRAGVEAAVAALSGEGP